MLGMEQRKGMLYEVILVKDEGHSRIWGQRARVTPTWGPESRGLHCGDQGQELSPDSDYLHRIHQNPQLPTPGAHHLLTLPSRVSSTETSRKKK